MKISRRDLLWGGAAATACAAIGSVAGRPALAIERGPARNLVLLFNYGGWDPTYSMDPKPGLSTVDAPEGSVRMFGDLPILTHASRPSVDAFFERWGSATALVNGLQVQSFVHPDCAKRVLTGSASETTPDMGAIAAWELGRDLPVPYLSLGVSARSGPLAAITGRTGTTNQLITLVDPNEGYGEGYRPTGEESGAIDAFLAVGAERLRATRGQRAHDRRLIEDFEESLRRADRLVEFSREGGGFGGRTYTRDLATQIPLAVRAIREGLAHSAMLEKEAWDSHQDNTVQSGLHEDLFAALSQLAGELEANDMLDSTLVVVCSEMGRTPKLNADGGKDHWPVTSALFFGAGVRGGRLLGGTTDELGALTVDLDTGEPDPGGQQLLPQNLVAGVLEAVGVDPEPYLPSVAPFRGFRADA